MIGAIIITLVVTGLMVSYWLPKSVIRTINKFCPNVKTHFKTETRKICLTFDDVPYRSDSYKEIINLLDQYEMKATFFVVSSQITDESRKILIDAVQKGHQLGNHGKTDTMHALHDLGKLENEINHCHELIKSIYEEANVELPKHLVYRPGSGFFTPKMMKLVEKLNHKLVLGSVYPNDPIVRLWYINYLYMIYHIEAGDIAIIHDRSWSVPLLKRFMPYLKKKNLTSITLDDVLT